MGDRSNKLGLTFVILKYHNHVVFSTVHSLSWQILLDFYYELIASKLSFSGEGC
jgi:hypothetical protein